MAKKIRKHLDMVLVVGFGLFFVMAAIITIKTAVSLPFPSVQAATTSATSVVVTATVAETIEITVSSTEMAFGALDSGSINSTSDNNFAVKTNAGGGYTVTLEGTGGAGGDDPGLYSATTTNLIVSADASPLTTGSEGYGAQGTTTDSDVGIYTKYDVYDTPDDVGGITETSASNFCSSTSATVGDQVTLRLKATISPITSAATDYTDTLTLTAIGSF